MRFLLFTVLSVALLGCLPLTHSLNLDSLLEPDHALDVNAKPCVLTPELFAQIQQPAVGSIKKYVLIAESLPQDFADRSAQMLSTSGFEVCRFPATVPAAGDVSIVDELGRSVIFYGRRQAEALFNFVQKHDAMLSSVHAFQTITNKMEKKALDSILEPKMVAFVPDITQPAWALFQQVATQVSAQMPVFVTHDAHMAAKFRITAANQLVIINRLEKSYTHFSLDPTAMGVAVAPTDVINWVNQNRGLVIHELDDLNLYDPELRDPNKYVFVAIGDKASPFGIYFHKALMKTIRNITKENRIIEKMALVQQQQATLNPGTAQPLAPTSAPILLDDVEIVWIDAAKFPNAVKKFATHFQIPATITASKVGRSLQFGLMQAPAGMATLPVGTSQWFNVASLFPAPGAIQQKFDEHLSISVLKNWLLTMSNRLPVAAVPVAGQTLPAQDFVLEPEPVVVQQGASFILNCKTVNKHGKCQWQKDGIVLPVSTVGHFRLVNAEDPEDCSLSVSGADPVRDDGLWSCHVTPVIIGQSTIEAISSNPVEVVVTPTPVKQAPKQKNKQKNKKAKKAPKTEL